MAYLGPRFLGQAPLAPRHEPATPAEHRSGTSCHTACAIDASAILEGLLGYGRRSSCTGDFREGCVATRGRPPREVGARWKWAPGWRQAVEEKNIAMLT